LLPPTSTFHDDFETYSVGSFPYEGGWILQYAGAGYDYQKVVDSISYSPSKSLQLLGWGVDGGSHMAAVALHPVELGGLTYGYEAHVLVDQICAFDSSAIVSFGKPVSGGFKHSSGVRFCSDGMITTWVDGGEKCGTPLQTYSPYTWYKVYMELDVATDTYSIWIDDVLRGSNFNARVPAEEITHFALTSNYGNTNAYFDDVTVFGVVGGTNIVVDPDVTDIGIGETFTTRVWITNVENLYGLDIRLGWDPAFLDFVNHTVTIPVENHVDGILHQPVTELKDEVNHTTGTYWIAFMSLSPAAPFNGSGMAVDITFQTTTYGTCDLTIESSDLADFDGDPISHGIVNANITIHDFHDIAITGLTIGKTVIGEGYCTNLTVSVVNQGTFPENFTVILLANGTTISETPTNLTAGDSDVIGFVWNTTEWSKGYYVLGASVPPVTNETDTADNEYLDGGVFLTIPGDIDGDRDIDIFDAVEIGRVYGLEINDLQYDPISDINDDGSIDIFDIVIAVSRYGEHW
jgi:hypothetical protein